VFDNAAMDGFAVRSTDDQTRNFRVVGTVLAGSVCFPPLKQQEAVRIMTGAPLPSGADAVIPFEETIFDASSCRFSRPILPGENVRRAGEDVHRGDVVLQPGQRIGASAVALLAALGIQTVPVARIPTVNAVVTGGELTEPGEPLLPGKIYNSNGPALRAALHETGIEAVRVETVCDDADHLSRLLKSRLSADVLITIGGVSAGDADLVPQVLSGLGASIIFHQVAIKPGKPFLFATRGKTLIFGLPGNPVSSLIVFERFVRPALLQMMGSKSLFRQTLTATMLEDLTGSAGKEDYQRGLVTVQDGTPVACSAGAQGAAQLLSLARANAILIIPVSRTKISAGETVQAEILSEVL
jgi:molybdopterin molybdotransferase